MIGELKNVPILSKSIQRILTELELQGDYYKDPKTKFFITCTVVTYL
jgi:hypothetical protein